MTPAVTDDFVAGLAARAQEAEDLRSLPEQTLTDYHATGLSELLVPKRYGGLQAPYSAILEPVRRMAHGCTASAWTLGFYTLHNWLLALFPEQAQIDGFEDRPFLAPAPLAPSGRGLPSDGGVRLTGRWSWATGVNHGNWLITGSLCGPDDAIRPALTMLPLDQAEVIDTWHTDGMRATGSNDVRVDDVFVPDHRILGIQEIYAGTTPGADLHDDTSYRWPMVPALSLFGSMPVLGSAERMVELFATRLAERVMGFDGTKQQDKPMAQALLAQSQVRLRSLKALVDDTVGGIEDVLAAGDRVAKLQRARARLAASYVVHESRAVINELAGASGASAHFLSSPLQRIKRDVDVLAGHAVFDHDAARELTGALELGLTISPFAMV